MNRTNSTIGHVTVKFPINITVISVLTLIVLTFVFGFRSNDVEDTLVFFSTGAAAVGMIVSAFYTARTLQAILARDAKNDELEQRREERAEREEKRTIAEMELKKKSLALQYGERWNKPDMYHVRNVLREIMDHPNDSADQLIKFVDENARRTNVIHIFNFLE